MLEAILSVIADTPKTVFLSFRVCTPDMIKARENGSAKTGLSPGGA